MILDVLTSSFLSLHGKLHRIAMSYLENDEDAKDVLQDIWLKLRDKGDIETSLEARNKLVAVLRNACIDRLRKIKTIPIDTVSVDKVQDALSGESGECIMEEEDVKSLEILLQVGLTPLQKQIFDLVTHSGYSYEQIAESLSMSVEAVRMNMSRTRKKIRENYNKLNR